MNEQSQPTIPQSLMPLPEQLRRLVLQSLQLAGEEGMSLGELRRRAQGSKLFGELVVLGVTRLVSEGILTRETVKQAGRGRPRDVVKFKPLCEEAL